MEEEEEEKKPFDGCQQNKRRHRHREVCRLRCVASLVFVRLVKAGDVELNPGPRDKRGESGQGPRTGLHVVEV